MKEKKRLPDSHMVYSTQHPAIKVVVKHMCGYTRKESWINLRYCISIHWSNRQNINNLSDIK